MEELKRKHLTYWKLMRDESRKMVGKISPSLCEGYQQAYLAIRRMDSIEAIENEYKFWHKVSKKGDEHEKQAAVAVLDAIAKLGRHVKHGDDPFKSEMIQQELI